MYRWKKYHVLEEPTSLNRLELLSELMMANITAVKIEGHQRSPTYVGNVTHIWRQAIDHCRNDPKKFTTKQKWMAILENLSESKQTTLGAYHRQWQ